MDQQVKTEWLAALRSGDYTQGINRLKKKDIDSNVFSYCCLGVLCEICNVETISISPGFNFDYYTFGIESDRSGLSLPEYFRNKINLSINEVDTLTEMNDIKKLDFNQIADYIEKNL